MTVKTKAETLVTVFGGSGFLGRHVVRALANRGYRIRVAVRRPELTGYLRPMGKVGQIQAVQANLRYPQSIAAAMRDADIAVNLVGILFERGQQRFDAIQAAGAEAVALAAQSAGARLVHVSAIGADAKSPSHYARSKAEGERRVLAAAPAGGDHAAVDRVRPRRRFLQPLCARSPASLRRCRFRAAATPASSRSMRAMSPRRLRLRSTAAPSRARSTNSAGPDVHTFRELMEFVLATIHRRRLLISVPFEVMSLQAAFAQFLPKPPITPDQVEMLKRDNVVSDEARREGRTLEALGIIPETIEAIVPTYLWRFRKTGQFDPNAGITIGGSGAPLPPRPIARVGTWPQNACSFRNEILTVPIFDPILGRGGPPHMLATAC